MGEVDWQKEGMLDGIEGRALEGRRELLDKLYADGVGLEELREAVAGDRLALVPLELVLGGDGPCYTRDEVAEKSGLELEILRTQWRAIGMSEPEPDQAIFTERDVEAAKVVKQFRELGIPDDEILQVSRVIGISMSQLAAANRGLGARVFRSEDDTELEVAERFAAMTRGLPALLTPTLEYVLQLHMREQVRHDAFGSDIVSDGVGSGVDVAVAFADLVGFTKLGERLDPEQIGNMTSRLGELAGDVATGPVRLVKMIGDAAMMTSGDPEALLDAALELVAASEREGEGFPLLRAGAAFGPAVPRAGDFYGRPVNLASRITAIARPGSVLCAVGLQEAAPEGRYEFSFAGAKHLKGIDGETKLFRVRNASVSD